LAKFNPDVPNANDPNYLGYSRPISQPQGDQSLEVLFKGLGNALEGGIKGADLFMQEKVKSEVYDAFDKEREIQTLALETVRGKSVPGAEALEDGLGAETDAGLADDMEYSSQKRQDRLIPSEQPRRPLELEKLREDVESLHGSYASGKVPQSYYTGRLNALAKELRAKYPGYRDYVDRTISSVIGGDPANMYIRTLTQELNQAAAGNRSVQNKAVTMIQQAMKDGIDGAPEMMSQVLSGQATIQDVTRWMAPRYKLKWEYEQRKMVREDANASREFREKTAKTDAELMVSEISANLFDKVTMGVGGNTPTKILEALRLHQNGVAKIPDEQWEGLAQQLEAFRKTAFTQAWKKVVTERDANGNTIASYLGGAEEARKIINANLGLYDEVIKNIRAKEGGAAFTNARRATAIIHDAQADLLDKDTGKWLRIQGALREIGGSEYSAKFFERFIMKDPKFAEGIQHYVGEKLGELEAQPDMRTSGVPTTMKDVVNEMVRKKGVTKEAIAEVVRHPEKLNDPKVPDGIKLNLIRSIFNERNQGFIQSLNKDGVDPQTGRRVQGQMSTFVRFTNPGTMKEIMRLTEKDPQLRQDVIDWTEKTFANELFSTTLKDLNEYSSEPNIKVLWNDKTKVFEVLDTTPKGTMAEHLRRGVGNTRVAEVERQIQKLNMGLISLGNLAQATGRDVEGYLLQTLHNQGIDLSRIEGIPNQMFHSLKNSTLKKHMKKRPTE